MYACAYIPKTNKKMHFFGKTPSFRTFSYLFAIHLYSIHMFTVKVTRKLIKYKLFCKKKGVKSPQCFYSDACSKKSHDLFSENFFISWQYGQYRSFMCPNSLCLCTLGRGMIRPHSGHLNSEIEILFFLVFLPIVNHPQLFRLAVHFVFSVC